MKRLIFNAFILLILVCWVTGCTNPTYSSSATTSTSLSDTTATSGTQSTATPSVTEPTIRQIHSLSIYRGALDNPLNRLFTLSENTAPGDLDIVAQALSHAEEQPGLVDMVLPDYLMVLDFEEGQESYYLWIGQSSGEFMSLNKLGTVYWVRNDDSQRLYGIISSLAPISVYEYDTNARFRIAINQVTEEDKQNCIKKIMHDAIWEPMNDSFDQMMGRRVTCFTLSETTYLVWATKSFDLIITDLRQTRHFHLTSREGGADMVEALGIRLLHGMGFGPSGNGSVLSNYAGIFYTVNGYLMQGTAGEHSPIPEHWDPKSETGTLIAQYGLSLGKSFFLTGEPDRTLSFIYADPIPAELKPLIKNVQRVLAVSEHYIYYSGESSKSHLSSLRRKSIEDAQDILIKDDLSIEAVVDETSGSLYHLNLAPVQIEETQTILVRCRLDGSGEKVLDRGSLDQLSDCGTWLVYRKGGLSSPKIWMLDKASGQPALLYDPAANAPVPLLELNLAGSLNGWIYFSTFSIKDGTRFYRISPNQPGQSEILWSLDPRLGILINVDMQGEWLYYRTKISGQVFDELATRFAPVLLPESCYRCRFDGTNNTWFATDKAINPVTIEYKWVYYQVPELSPNKYKIMRYDIEKATTENLWNGYPDIDG
jgi:hypothetical protein